MCSAAMLRSKAVTVQNAAELREPELVKMNESVQMLLSRSHGPGAAEVAAQLQDLLENTLKASVLEAKQALQKELSTHYTSGYDRCDAALTADQTVTAKQATFAAGQTQHASCRKTESEAKTNFDACATEEAQLKTAKDSACKVPCCRVGCFFSLHGMPGHGFIRVGMGEGVLNKPHHCPKGLPAGVRIRRKKSAKQDDCAKPFCSFNLDSFHSPKYIQTQTLLDALAGSFCHFDLDGFDSSSSLFVGVLTLLEMSELDSSAGCLAEGTSQFPIRWSPAGFTVDLVSPFGVSGFLPIVSLMVVLNALTASFASDGCAKSLARASSHR